MLSKEQQDIIENSLWVVNTALKRQGLQTDEDLRQSAILYMCRCLEKFDPSRNIKWTTFAYKNIYLYIKRVHRAELKKQFPLLTEETLCFIERKETTRVFEQALAEEEIAVIKQGCTEDECKFIDLKIQGYKGAEIGEIMECSQGKVMCLRQSIKEKIRGKRV